MSVKPASHLLQITVDCCIGSHPRTARVSHNPGFSYAPLENAIKSALLGIYRFQGGNF
ncbi:MAG: hypothetical protein ACK5GN_00720 [Pseudomonadota bacterium]